MRTIVVDQVGPGRFEWIDLADELGRLVLVGGRATVLEGATSATVALALRRFDVPPAQLTITLARPGPAVFDPPLPTRPLPVLSWTGAGPRPRTLRERAEAAQAAGRR